MQLVTSSPTPQEGPSSQFLLYLASAISRELGDMFAAYPSLGNNGDFCQLYDKSLSFYEEFENGDVTNITVGPGPDNLEAAVADGYGKIAANLGKKRTITLEEVEAFYDFVVLELRKIINKKRGIIAIGETALKLPPSFSQPFEQFKDGVDQSTARDYFEEAKDSAADSIVLGELPGGIDAVIASVRNEVWDRVWERIARGGNPVYDLLAEDQRGDEAAKDTIAVEDNGKDQAELIRLMALTDVQLAQATTVLGKEVIEAITHYRQLVRDDFAFGNGPLDQEIRAEWTARIKSKPRPKLTLVGDGDERKDPKRAPSSSDSGTSPGSTGGDAARTSVLDAA